ncbi:hypothetical protein Cagg_1003 [Chloroflexus aggregans DSM 9485]|uniref:Uncharacterized protein n=1 Tax=Chloroflexus aggregans (strain MD-66 / DSM 9485) TaxID=326427 RepID=B8G6I3_CHLAD|nr:hypothetical protein Cagg_1003 [Chloroflexus aggregans DSM 9485]
MPQRDWFASQQKMAAGAQRSRNDLQLFPFVPLPLGEGNVPYTPSPSPTGAGEGLTACITASFRITFSNWCGRGALLRFAA